MVNETKEGYALIEKVLAAKDVFFNNGIINVLEYLETGELESLDYTFQNNKLIFRFDKKNEDEIYNKLLENFINRNNIVFLTDNDRIYWSTEKNSFIKDKKFDVQGKASANDVKYLYNYISPREINVSTQELYETFKKFAVENNLKDKEINDFKKCLIDEETSYFKPSDKKGIPLHMTKQKGISNFAEYLAGKPELPFDSKVHQFEDGGFCFRDMLFNKNNIIKKWDALIYWYGSRIKRLFYLSSDSSYYIYINSSNLHALYQLKSYLKIYDDRFEIRDETTGKIKALPTNIDLYTTLSKDGIKNSNFYISSSQQEFQLKVLLYLFSVVYHIEDYYQNRVKDERRKKQKEELFNSLKDIVFFTYTENGSMKSSLSEYSKAYRLFKLFNEMISIKIRDSDASLFKYLSDLMTVISLSKSEKEENLNIKRFADNLLNFRHLRKNYFEAVYDILKNDKKVGVGKDLATFENLYLDFIGRGEMEMNLHMQSKKLGDEIGLFVSTIEDENLLFKLRNVKNFKQLVSYFKDLKYSALKNQEDERFTREFNEILVKTLDELDECPENWELVRDYIAIYAIDKYKIVNYAKSLKGGK